MGSRLEILKSFLQARRRARWSRAQLQAHHRKHGCNQPFPIETSEQFETHFVERNLLRLTLEQARQEAESELEGNASSVPGFSWGLSTGTMGNPGLFLTSDRERNQWIGTVLAKFLPLRLFAGTDIALVLRRHNRLYADVNKTRTLRLHYFDAASPIAELSANLCALAPKVLIGPPHLLEQVASSDAFRAHPFQPQVLIAGAEPLFPQDKQFLWQAYSVEPRVIYQAREGFLAAGCSAGGIHLNEDLIYFQSLQLDRNRFVPVITDFTRTSQTYRRFRLDDILISTSLSCPCGSANRAISAIEGRANDVLLLHNKRLFPLELNSLLLPFLATGNRALDYQITQHSPEQFTIAVEGGTPGDIIRVLSQHIASAQLSVASYHYPMPGEKRRRVRRLFDPRNEWLNTLKPGASLFQ